MPHYKLGKQRVRHDPRTLRYATYRDLAIAPPPAARDWTKPVKVWGMMGNDTYGDCTCAAAGHMIMEWSANTGTEVTVPDPDIISFYNHFAHGNADAGANMLDVLKYWRSHGLDKHKVNAFASLTQRNDEQVKDAINLFGACYIGVALPDFAVAPGTDFLKTPWEVPPGGPVGKAAPNPDNGHCIPAMAYDDGHLYVITWGARKAMSWAFYNAYAEESYAVLSTQWIAKKTGDAPPGFNMTALKKDLSQFATA